MELHCANGFEELDQALRAGMGKDLSPEQLTALLQATAGVYQDLRMEIKKRMRVFEEYALAEILRLPPGLLADPSAMSGTEAEAEALAGVTEEEEKEIDAEMKRLQQEVSDEKQRGRDIKATTRYLELLVSDVKEKMRALDSVPNVLGPNSKSLEKDVEFVVEKGQHVLRGMSRLEALQRTEGVAGGREDGAGVDREMVAVISERERGGEGVGAGAVGLKQAEDLRAFRESLLGRGEGEEGGRR